jgi:hypothetical protein
MVRRAHERKPSGELDLDFCHRCHVIWFDQYESTALTPGAVIALFGEIHAHHETPPRPIAESLRCPKCRRPLKLTHDIQGTSRFTYHRCEAGCGRLTTFFQFLREKQFVRTLSPHEVSSLRAQVAQVCCSSCGARLELERETACRYCRAPISILDADAVRKTLAQLTVKEQARHRPIDPVTAVDAVLQGQRASRRVAYSRGARPGSETWGGVDLVGEALDVLMQILD